MTERFDPAGYPGPRPSGPVLVQHGRAHPATVDGVLGRPVSARVDADVLAPGRVRWSVAYGANACPDRLVDKGLDRRGALLLPARLGGWAPVFEARRTSYGAVPLTLAPVPGRYLDTWVLGVDVDDVATLDRSEGRVAADATARTPADATTGWPAGSTSAAPGRYVLGRVGAVAVADRFLLPDALAFLPGPSTTVQRDGDGWLTWPEHDQQEAVRGLDTGGTSAVPAPQPDAPVHGSWPPTPLVDPPLFVYGTLRPGGSAWDVVADLVEVLGEVRAPGRLHDTGRGYPAAAFDVTGPAAATEVHGVLLAPRGADAARELLRRVDRYEGCPPYGRVAVRVTGADRWALSYTWAAGDPPGPPVPGGRWRDAGPGG